MHIATARLTSTSPYGQSKYIQTPKQPKETFDAHEKRVWRERMHASPDGYLMIPGQAFKHALDSAAKWLSLKLQGNKTYTKRFEAGVLCFDPIITQYKVAKVDGLWLHVPSDGKPGGSKRVLKCFPHIPGWSGDVTFHVLDDLIEKEIFTQHLEAAGDFIGVGFYRPERRGFWGRFKVEKVRWEEG